MSSEPTVRLRRSGFSPGGDRLVVDACFTAELKFSYTSQSHAKKLFRLQASRLVG